MSSPDGREALARELENRSHDVDGHRVTFAAVKGSARRLQWRRRAAGGVTAAAVLGVAVPAGVAISNDVNHGQRLVHLPTPVVPSPDHATPRPDGSYTLAMAGLPQGPDPRLVYLYGHSLNLPDGSVVDLPAAYSEIVDTGPGWLVHGSGTTSAFLDPGGRVLQTGTMEKGFAVSADGSHVGAVRVEPSGSDTLLSMPVVDAPAETWSAGLGSGVSAVGYVGRDRLVWQGGGAHPRVGIASPQGVSYLRGLLSAGGTSEADGLVSGVTTVSGGRSCSAVVEPSTGIGQLWTTCNYTLGKFSPDGQYVVGTDAYGEGRGSRTLAVLDAHNGELVVSYSQAHDSRVVLTEVVWEGDDHLLAVANEGDTWRILRLDLHGVVEQTAVPAIARPSEPVPFHLATQP